MLAYNAVAMAATAGGMAHDRSDRISSQVTRTFLPSTAASGMPHHFDCSRSSHNQDELDRSDASKQSTGTVAACMACHDGGVVTPASSAPASGTASHSSSGNMCNRHALESSGWDSDSESGEPRLSRLGSDATSTGSWEQYAAMEDVRAGNESPDAAAVRHQARMLASVQVPPRCRHLTPVIQHSM